MQSITVTAPGKLMLFGEHAVVYGQPCLVTAVNQRMTVELYHDGNKPYEVDLSEIKDARFVSAIIDMFKEKFHLKIGKLHIKTNCGFSGKYGFGSSSAVTTAMVGAMSEIFNLSLNNKQIFDLSYEVVLKVQGVGSGFDIAAATFGGLLYFVKGGQVLENLPLDLNQTCFVVGYSGIKSNTVEIIQQVAQKRAQEPEKFDRIMNAIGELVNQVKPKLLSHDWERVGKFMDFNQEYLRDLGVSNQKLEDLIAAAKNAGAWGAKLSGAGGGDCMIAISGNDKREAIEKAIEKAGGEALNIKMNAEGVKIER